MIGVDFSSEMIELAKPLMEKHEGLTFLQGDAQELPMATGVFDAAVIAFGLLHLPSPMRCLAEVHRVLKPGGSAWRSPCGDAGRGLGFKTVLDAMTCDPNVPLPGGDDVTPSSTVADAAACGPGRARRRRLCRVGESRSLPLKARLEIATILPNVCD